MQDKNNFFNATANQPPLIGSTERLLMRSMQADDAELIFRYRNQPQVSDFQGWTPASPQEVAEYADEMKRYPLSQPGRWFQVVIEEKENNLLIGDIAFCIDTETQKQAELGIALGGEHQGKGFAQEAVSALLDFLFSRIGLHRVHVSIDPANTASRNLFRRVSFREEGHLVESVYFKGKWCDDIIMAILRQEWSEKGKT